MPGHLNGKVAVVTGAGGGIGRAHALALAAEGAKVVVNDLGVDLDGADGSGATRQRAAEVAEEIRARGGTAISNAESVASYDSARRIVAVAVETFGHIDILINNASVFRDGPFAEMTAADFSADVDVHLVGTFNMCKTALEPMVAQRWGRIINTTSSAWYTGTGYAGYAAVKGAIASLTYDLAEEYRHLGITVNAVAPGALTEYRRLHGVRWLDRVRAAGIPVAPGPAAPPR